MTNTPSQPIIGISCADIKTPSAQAIIKRVSEAGGSPMLITDHAKRNVREDFEQVHALVIMGNDFDIDPIHYIHRYPDGDPRKSVHPSTRSELDNDDARARAKYENGIMEMALRDKMPMLGICGGMQRINVLCGGTLHQHVPDMVGDDRHMQHYHNIPGEIPIIPVLIQTGTRMAIIARRIQMTFIKSTLPGLTTVIMENSFRHQSIDMVGKGLQVCALSDVLRQPDGTSQYLIEAIESAPGGPYGDQFLIGVQWHPEFSASEIGKALMKDLVRHANVHRQ
jgi:putative glutamine amidotransferase